jgi:phosphatidylserine decarboxylase
MGTSLLETIKKTVLVKPHAAGLPFIAGGVVAALILWPFSHFLQTLALIFTAFCLYFFRDPERVTPQKASLVVAPGDGVVSGIAENVPLPRELADGDDTRYTRVSIFLSVLDVHVNRIPVSGKVTRKVYTPGKFLNAALDKASEDNERCGLMIETADGKKTGAVQIAGLVARRIVNDINEGQSVKGGARMGIIRFGSRADVYLPEGAAPLVCVGQRAVGGETVLADLESKEAARTGAIVP